MAARVEVSSLSIDTSDLVVSDGKYIPKPGDIKIIDEKTEKASYLSVEVKNAVNVAQKVSNAYEEYAVLELLSPSLTEFSPEGKALFELIYDDLIKQLEYINDGHNITMEDWRSVDWESILPDHIPAPRVNNKVIWMMFRTRLTDFQK